MPNIDKDYQLLVDLLMDNGGIITDTNKLICERLEWGRWKPRKGKNDPTGGSRFDFQPSDSRLKKVCQASRGGPEGKVDRERYPYVIAMREARQGLVLIDPESQEEQRGQLITALQSVTRYYRTALSLLNQNRVVVQEAARAEFNNAKGDPDLTMKLGALAQQIDAHQIDWDTVNEVHGILASYVGGTDQ